MDCHRQSSPYEPKGQGFESLTPYQKSRYPTGYRDFCISAKFMILIDCFPYNRRKAIDFVFFMCCHKLSYTTDGFSGIDHGEYRGRADRLGITLSAWAFAGLSGNQLATWIVNHFGDLVEIEGHMVNPTGYQIVLYVTAALYLVALLLSVVLVRPVSQQKKDN